jgi:hypothetical protein
MYIGLMLVSKLMRLIMLAVLCIAAIQTSAQVRFYLQYRGIPFYKGGATDFSVLTGVKLDPNKELVVGIGLTGSFTPKDFNGDLKFNKSTFSLGFNYYLSRKFYLGADASLNTIQNIVTSKAVDADKLSGKYFLDYQFRITYVVLRRLHFSINTGIMDFSRLVSKNTTDLIEKQDFKPNVALSLRLYVFQIKI